ncbi:hypothetical protein K439DRAFT_1634788, partial [Ramaria rubella]
MTIASRGPDDMEQAILFHFTTAIPLVPLSLFKAHTILIQCQQFTASQLLLQRLGVVLQATVLVLRTYAIYEYNMKVLIGLGSLGLVVTVFNFVSAYGGKHTSCIIIISATAYASLVQFMVAVWLANIYLADSGIEHVAEGIATSLRVAFEIILIVLTIWRTANAFKRQKTRTLLEPANLESLILRSGRPPVLCPGFSIGDACPYFSISHFSMSTRILKGFLCLT